jgi:hypothetical protein
VREDVDDDYLIQLCNNNKNFQGPNKADDGESQFENCGNQLSPNFGDGGDCRGVSQGPFLQIDFQTKYEILPSPPLHFYQQNLDPDSTGAGRM